MDFWEALRELHRERERLTTVIRNLEALVEGRQAGPLNRRGRKSMSPAERREVSERMKNYWAGRLGSKKD
jgi:hypothetical protein